MSFAGDVRAAARSLGRARGFTAAAIGTLTVAIAVNTALFSFVNAVFFRGLPYPDVERLHYVRLEPIAEPFEAPRVADVRAAVDRIADVAVYREEPMVVAATPQEPAASLTGTTLEAELFALLGVAPVAGRLPDTFDGVPGAPPVVVLDEDLAAARFGDAASAIGSVLRVDGTDRTVVGVLPAGLAFPDFARLWVPLEGALDRRLGGGFGMIARLSPGRPAEAVARRIEALETGAAARALVRPLQPDAAVEVAAILCAVAILLLIACGNVANLVLARGTARRHEFGVRAVLGASRGALLRVLLAEGGIMALAAAIGGGLLGAWLTDAVVALIPADQLPLWFRAQVDVRVLAWITGAAAVITVVVSGVPALVLTRGGLSALLAAGAPRGSDAHAGRLRAGLVAAQLALATTLLAGAGVLARSFLEMRRAHPGYDAHRVLQIDTRRAAVAQDDRFAEDAMRGLGALAGVAGAAARLPLRESVRVSGPDRTAVAPRAEAVTPDFFRVIGLPIVRGRPFTDAEARSGRFALISESTADVLFGNAQDAIGRALVTDAGVSLTVLGVTRSRRDWNAGGLGGSRTALHLYVPAVLGDPAATELLLRVDALDPRILAASAVETIARVGREIVVSPPRTLLAAERERATDLRVFATLFGAFGALAMALAALGVYGVVAYSVSRRTREIGVRVALGAPALRIAGHVAQAVARPVAAGLVLGIFGAFAVTRLLRAALFGVPSADPLLVLLVLVVFAVTAAIAAAIPARRAARIDPLSALRTG